MLSFMNKTNNKPTFPPNLFRLSIGFCACLFYATSLYALEPGSSLKGGFGPDREKPLPEFLPEPNDEEFVLPEAPVELAPDERPIRKLFVLKALNFEGNTVFTDEQLNEVAKPFLNQSVGLADLEEIRLRLTNYYIKAGYVNSGAILPDQDAKNGIINYQITEGRLSEINITGMERLRPAYIRDRLWANPNEILNTKDLQQRFQLLLADPLVERLNGALKPGIKPGEGILDLKVKRAKAFLLNLGVDNHRSPSTGSEQIQVDSHIYNLSGFGDLFSIYASQTHGAFDLDLNYSIPINAQNTRLKFYYGYTNSTVIEEPLDQADIDSDYQYFEVGISHPLIHTLRDSLILESRIAFKRSRTFLFDEGTPFSPGVEDDGTSKTTVLRLSQEYTQRRTNQVLALRSTFNIGLDVADATIHSNLPDSKFFSWLGQAQYARRFDSLPGQLLLRGNIQLSNDELLPMERFAVGGATTVRGYRENSYVRDNGFWSSIEYRYPLMGDPDDKKKNSLQLAPFIDLGNGWNKGEWESDNMLSSVGLGFLWKSRRFSAELYLAHGFKNLSNPNEYNWQDDGITFKISTNIY